MCIIENKRTHFPVAHLMVVKHLVPSGDAGVFDLLIGGKVWAPGVSNHGSTGRLEFELGKHTVTEHAVDGTNLADFAVSTTCVNRAGHTVAHNAHGPSVTVDLASASDDIVRTITNQRTEGPEGGGQIPDIPGPLFAVEKRMPAPGRGGRAVLDRRAQPWARDGDWSPNCARSRPTACGSSAWRTTARSNTTAPPYGISGACHPESRGRSAARCASRTRDYT